MDLKDVHLVRDFCDIYCLTFSVFQNLIHKHVNSVCESLPSYVKPVRMKFLGRKIDAAAKAQE